MFSRYRHAALVAGLAARSPVDRAGPFSLYWLTEPAEAGPTLAAELVIVHDLVPADIDNNVGRHVRHSLIPMLDRTAERLGAVPVWGVWPGDPHDTFTRLVALAVYSAHANEVICWRWFYENTLRELRRRPADIDELDFIAPFGEIYRRVAELRRGATLLDVGTAHGFLPLFLASDDAATAPAPEPGPEPHLVGIDIAGFLTGLARRYATDTASAAVRFDTMDLFGEAAARLPPFDTVTAIHLLEHLPPDRVEAALDALWRLTGQRLIINVPIEETPDPYFDHRQRFDVDRLAALGERWDRPVDCFAHHGAWLVVDRD